MSSSAEASTTEANRTEANRTEANRTEANSTKAAQTAITESQQWFDRVVLGLNLCPFAHQPAREKRVRWRTLEDTSRLSFFKCLENEAKLLEESPAETVETTLIVFVTEDESEFADFYCFNQLLAEVDDWLACNQWEGFIQVASFHPNYQFTGTRPEDPENLTNRSPFPILHLLREASLSAVIDAGADTESVPQRNIARVNKLSLDQKRELFPYLEL